jgi:1-acyl-sn-glycerol-3-phosphate acyltransferase
MLLAILAAISLIAAVAVCISADSFLTLAWLWQLPVGFVAGFLGLALLYFLFLWLMCAVVDLEKPQKKDSPFYRALVTLTAGAARVILQMRIHTTGMEKLPKKGRFLLVCNHLDILDPVVLMHLFPGSQLAFISKRENSSMFLVGKLLHKILGQMINRENDREALKTILRCVQILQEDTASVAVFPEGYVSLDGLLHPFRNGVFKIAQKAKVPIVVCTLQNTNRVFKNARRLKPTDVHMHLVAVVPPEDLQGRTTADIGARIHALMAEDLGPELVLS